MAAVPVDMDDTKLSVLDHLEEMRMRILRSLACAAVLFPIFFFLSEPTIDWLLETFCPQVEQLHYMQPLEYFFTKLKVGAVMAIAGAYPYIALQVWRFVAPGLYKHERFYVSRFVFVSTGLFLFGALFALFGVYPMILRFAVGMATERVTPLLQIKYVVNLAAMLMLAFGLMFQLPILVYLLAITELVTVETMRKARPIIVVVVFSISAVLTPPDIISQLALGLPSLLLFEGSLLVSARALRRKRRREEQEEAARAAETAAGTDDSPPDGDAETVPDEQPDTPPVAQPAAESSDADITPEEDGDIYPEAAEQDTAESEYDEEDFDDDGWEEWYTQVEEEEQEEQDPAKTPPRKKRGHADSTQPDPYDDGPAGSGLI